MGPRRLLVDVLWWLAVVAVALLLFKLLEVLGYTLLRHSRPGHLVAAAPLPCQSTDQPVFLCACAAAYTLEV
jgi:hypothetical protein